MSIYYPVADRSSTLFIIKALTQQPCRIYHAAVKYPRDLEASRGLAEPEYSCSNGCLTPFPSFLIVLGALLDVALPERHNLGTPRTENRGVGAVKNLPVVAFLYWAPLRAGLLL